MGKRAQLEMQRVISAPSLCPVVHLLQDSGGGQRQYDVPRGQRGGAFLRVPGRRLDLPTSGMGSSPEAAVSCLKRFLIFCLHRTQLIVGVLAFAIGLLTLLLPETLGQPLTNTLKEAEALGDKPSKTSSGLCCKDAVGVMEMTELEAKA